jgi:hypothetical protein
VTTLDESTEDEHFGDGADSLLAELTPSELTAEYFRCRKEFRHLGTRAKRVSMGVGHVWVEATGWPTPRFQGSSSPPGASSDSCRTVRLGSIGASAPWHH